MKNNLRIKFLLIILVLFSCEIPEEHNDPVAPIIGNWIKIEEVTHVIALTDTTQLIVDYRRPMTPSVNIEGGSMHSLSYFSHGISFWEGNYIIELTEKPALEYLFNSPTTYLRILDEDSTSSVEFNDSGHEYTGVDFMYSFDRSSGLLHIPHQYLYWNDTDSVSVACSTIVPLLEFTAMDTTNLYTFNPPLASRNLEYLQFFHPESLHVMRDSLALYTIIGVWEAKDDSLILNYGKPFNRYEYSIIDDTLNMHLRIDDSFIEQTVEINEQLLPNSLIDAWFINSSRWVRL